MPESLVQTALAKTWIRELVEVWDRDRAARHRELERIFLEFGNVELLAKAYVEQDCQAVNPADFHEEEPLRAHRVPVRHWLNGFLKAGFKARDGRNTLFLLADAGMGKTSLLMMLKFTHLFKLWPDGLELSLLKLGETTLDDIAAIHDRRRTVLLLDALDEDPLAWGRTEERMKELLRETSSFRQAIISCHTQFFPADVQGSMERYGKMEIGGFIFNLLYLSPFSDQQVVEYLSKVFPETLLGRLLRWLTGKENPKLERARQVVVPMQSLRMRPMLLAYVEDLMETNVREWTPYRVYEALIDRWLLREARRGPATRDELWQACIVVASYLYEEGLQFLKEDELRKLLQKHVADHLQELYFGGRSLLSRTSEGSYRFAHYSVQEFLVARGLIDSISRGKTPRKAMRVTVQLLAFLKSGLEELPKELLESAVPWSILSRPDGEGASPFFVQTPAEAAFLETVAWGRPLLRRLEEDGARVMRLRTLDTGVWLLQLRLPEKLRELYGTASEVLLLATAGRIRGENLERAQAELGRREFDLDLDLLLVVDGHPDLEERLARIYQQWGQWVPWSPVDGVFPPLAEIFQPHLSPYDIFEEKDPVRGRQMIGRGALIADLSRRLQQGQSLGVFGLRKVGKTTLVRAVTDKLDPVSRLPMLPKRLTHLDFGRIAVPVVWLDVQGLYPLTLESLAEQLTRDLEQRLRLEHLDLPPRPSAEARPLAALHHLLQYALQEERQPVCIVLDEYDLLFESERGDPGVEGIDELFRMFRGHAQRTDRLALVVIGRDSEFFDRPEMSGRPNPMLNWFIPRWLGPMEPPEADELLRRLGRRAGLDIGKGTARLARRWTGGHPLLHRQLGSALLELAHRQEKTREHLPTDPFREDAIELFLDRDSVLNICREVHLLLAKRYPEASSRLGELSRTATEKLPAALEAAGGWRLPAARTLRRFGLLLGTPDAPAIPELFRWYYRAVLPEIDRIAV